MPGVDDLVFCLFNFSTFPENKNLVIFAGNTSRGWDPAQTDVAVFQSRQSKHNCIFRLDAIWCFPLGNTSKVVGFVLSSSVFKHDEQTFLCFELYCKNKQTRSRQPLGKRKTLREILMWNVVKDCIHGCSKRLWSSDPKITATVGQLFSEEMLPRLKSC